MSDDDLIRSQRIEQLRNTSERCENFEKKVDGLLLRAYAYPRYTMGKMNHYLGDGRGADATARLDAFISALSANPGQFGPARANAFTKEGWAPNAKLERDDAAVAAKELIPAMAAWLKARAEVRRLELLLEPPNPGFFRRIVERGRGRPR